MHELGLCDALLKKVRQIAEESELEGVNSVTLEVGTLSGVIPRFMEDCWEAVIDGTPYTGTKLIIQSVPGMVLCEDCGARFEADLEHLVCPECEGMRLTPISGRDMTITEIEGY